MTGAPRILAVVGPTTSGKTEVSLAVAERLPVEIVSLDSRQLYAGMDVGTAKVSARERAAVPHHGLDLITPDQRYSAGQFARDARRWVAEIESRGRVPLFAGGTGFFLKAVMEPIFREPPLDPERRDALRRYLGDLPLETLADWVRRLDPDRAEMAIEGGPHRTLRTLEVALLTGIPLSRWHREAPPEADGLPAVVVVLDLPAEVVARRIDERVGRLVERGWLDEVRGLLEGGYAESDPGMTGHGYREIVAHLRGDMTLEEAMEEIRNQTRRYARRQRTWFRNQLPASAQWIDATQPVGAQADAVVAAWRAATGSGAAHRRASEAPA